MRVLLVVALVACREDAPPAAPPSGQTIRVAVIGGMVETGFWQALAERYQAARGNKIELVGRIPWVTGKLKASGVELMVRGDPRLRRPYLVEVSSSSPAAAHDLAAYMRSPDTQQWIATFKRGAFDDQPLFFPVSVP